MNEESISQDSNQTNFNKYYLNLLEEILDSKTFDQDKNKINILNTFSDGKSGSEVYLVECFLEENNLNGHFILKIIEDKNRGLNDAGTYNNLKYIHKDFVEEYFCEFYIEIRINNFYFSFWEALENGELQLSNISASTRNQLNVTNKILDILYKFLEGYDTKSNETFISVCKNNLMEYRLNKKNIIEFLSQNSNLKFFIDNRYFSWENEELPNPYYYINNYNLDLRVFKTISHGDLHTGNIFISLNDNFNINTIKFIDYGLSKYNGYLFFDHCYFEIYKVLFSDLTKSVESERWKISLDSISKSSYSISLGSGIIDSDPRDYFLFELIRLIRESINKFLNSKKPLRRDFIKMYLTMQICVGMNFLCKASESKDLSKSSISPEQRLFAFLYSSFHLKLLIENFKDIESFSSPENYYKKVNIESQVLSIFLELIKIVDFDFEIEFESDIEEILKDDGQILNSIKSIDKVIYRKSLGEEFSTNPSLENKSSEELTKKIKEILLEKVDNPNDFFEKTNSFLFNTIKKKKKLSKKDFNDYLDTNNFFFLKNLNNKKSIMEYFKYCSSILNNWNVSFIEYIERKEVNSLFSDILENNKTNLTALVSPAGSGKTIILKKLFEKLTDNNIITLAIKCDIQKLNDNNILDTEKILSYISMLSKENKIVVLIDQIDALSQSMSKNRDEINKYFEFISKLITFEKNVKVIISCRNFDLDYDPILKNFRNNVVTVSNFTKQDVSSHLDKLNIKITKDTLLELLCLPLHLSIFLEVCKSKSSDEIEKISNINDLFDILFDQAIAYDPKRVEFVKEIINKMNSNKELFFSDHLFKNYNDEKNSLLSEGIITK